jgi:hypothetical protein
MLESATAQQAAETEAQMQQSAETEAQTQQAAGSAETTASREAEEAEEEGACAW